MNSASQILPNPHKLIDKNSDSSKVNFGFWLYIMTDCVLFASLFATYAVLRNNTAGGEGGGELFDLPFILVETVILLMSSFTAGLAMLALRAKNKKQVVSWLTVTFLLGLTFVSMEIYEFAKLVEEGNSWTRSGFLSAYFTLVGTHGVHILTGLLWIIVLLSQLARTGITYGISKRIAMFSLFWHFLDIVWIFIFTIVYLMGGVSL